MSRVGGSAQIKAMKQVAGTLRIDLAQFRELQAFAQFGSDLDKATQAQLARGQRLVEILKQPQYQPMEVEKQVLLIWAATNGHLDEIPVDQVRRFESELLRFIENAHPGVLANIREKKSFTDEIKGELKQLVSDFKGSWDDKAFNPQPDPPRCRRPRAAARAAAARRSSAATKPILSGQ